MEEDETSGYTIKAFGSTFENDMEEEVQEVSDKQGFTQRPNKQPGLLLQLIESKQDLNLDVQKIKTIYLNVRHINTLGALDCLQNLKNFHKLSIIVFEPMIGTSKLELYKVQQTMEKFV